MSGTEKLEGEVRERKKECRYMMTINHICNMIGDGLSD
jgi:hypothetical protein